MGGRGAASGKSAQGHDYGTEFKTLLEVDNIKFVQYIHTENAKTPLETMSADKNRVYALINKFNFIKSITFYDKSGKLQRQIDLDHSHRGQNPHVHVGYEHSPETVPLNKNDEEYIAKVRKLWMEK
jgi:hypothetical protein